MMRISLDHRVPHVGLCLVALLLPSAGCSGWKFDWETGRFYDERRTTVRPGDGYEPQPTPTRTAGTVQPQPVAPAPQQQSPVPQPPPRAPAQQSTAPAQAPAPRPAPAAPQGDSQFTVSPASPSSPAPSARPTSPTVSSSASSTTPSSSSPPAARTTSPPPAPIVSPQASSTAAPIASAAPAAPAAAPAPAAPPPPAPAAPVAPPPAPRPTSPAAPADSSDSAYHRLLLVSGSTDAAEDGRSTQYVLRQATPRQAGQLLATLYRPLGPGGSESRYFLVYPTRWEMDAAQKILPALDVASAGASGAAAGEAFAPVVAEYYRVTEASDLAAAPKLAESLVALGNRADVYGPHRWAALMMAGLVQGELLGDLAAAQQTWESAERTAPPDSIESLMAGLARIEGLSFIGRRAEAADEAKRLVVAHQAYSRTAAYAECLRLAGP